MPRRTWVSATRSSCSSWGALLSELEVALQNTPPELGRLGRRRLGQLSRLLQFKQKTFTPEASTVARQAAIFANDAVARDEDADAIHAIGAGHGTLRGGLGDAAR